MRLSQLQGSIQSLHPPLARISWNHGMVWVGRDHKAHPAPAVGRDTFCYPRFFQPGLGHFQGRSRHFPGVPVAIPCVFHPSPARCSRPKAVANAHIEVGNNTGLHSLLRYSCDPGYKRKAGTSNLIQCVLRDGSARPGWTDPTLQCIRDPAAPPPQTPIPVIPTEPHTESTTRRGTSPTSSPSPAGKPGADGTPLDTSTPGEGTTPLPNAPSDNATASSQTLAYSIGKTSLFWEAGAHFPYFLSFQALGAVGAFIPWECHRGGKEAAPKLLPGKENSQFYPCQGGEGTLGLHPRFLWLFVELFCLEPGCALIHELEDAHPSLWLFHRVPGAPGHRNRGLLLLLLEEENAPTAGLRRDTRGHSHGSSSPRE
ncbi:interleukin-15 receptor subunit alpha isoform X2 [Pseudopipra pipra]|uniref:interleukin-15 receptor subunit alpha isoform X2 n=1 Tax=Pseudopipra pipra TaxID=415032 RepID=UPI003138B978